MGERMELPKHAFSAFFERIGDDGRLLPTHIGLVAALFYHHDCGKPHGHFHASRRKLMRFSRIRSIATYHKCLSELVAYGYVEYHPSWHPAKGSRFRFIIHGEDGAREKLKEFAMMVMDEYARNFKRPGIDSHRDLLWFGKLENHRYYGHNDREVKSGQKRKGERKEGRQMHVQIIVSRKDITNSIKLSPQNTSRGKNKAHSQKLGQFDRTAFKQSGETLFDELFDFERNLKDSLQYANTMKNGTAQQKAQMHTLTELTERHPQGQPLAMELAHDVAQGMFESVGDMLSSTVGGAAELLGMLLEPVHEGSQHNPIEEEEKRRKRKKKAQSRGVRR